MGGCAQYAALCPGGGCLLVLLRRRVEPRESGVWQVACPGPCHSFRVGQRGGPEPKEERGAVCVGKRAKRPRAGSGAVARAVGQMECGELGAGPSAVEGPWGAG